MVKLMQIENNLEEKKAISIPSKLPFLEGVCWHINYVYDLPIEQMLENYERGWDYRNLLDLEGEELEFLKKIAAKYKSWLVADL